MYVDGIGERPVIDSGGFPVIWNGAPCQDPAEGGTNCYGAGDVLYDAENGTPYQIGGDFHLRTMGSEPSSSPAPSAPAASVSDHFYYVDNGEIIEKTAYSDGSTTFNDTGMQSPLADGTVAPDPYTLANAAVPIAGTPPSSSDTGGGFQTPNGGGGYGPYATPDPPILRDLGTYADNGRLIDHQVDQYGNDYYTDVGAAPTSTPAAPPVHQAPVPLVPTPRITAPTVYAPGVSLLPTVPASPYPRPAGAPQSPTAPPGLRPTVPTAPVSGPSSGGPGQKGGAAPAITPTGNPTQWGHQVVTWLSAENFIGGVPNGLLVLGGVLGARMLQRRRLF